MPPARTKSRKKKRIAVTAPDEIRFGTDGWRGLIARDFTTENVTRVAGAITRTLIDNEDIRRGVLVAYDTRFGADRFARRVAEVVSSAGIEVGLATQPAPTPALSFAVHERQAAAGIMLTASHNSAEWLGIKLKSSFGGSALPTAVAEVEKILNGGTKLPRKLPRDFPRPELIRPYDFKTPYVKRLRELVSLEKIAQARVDGAPLRFAIDPMHGAGAGILRELFESHGIESVEVRGNPDPLFGGAQPEPLPQHLGPLREAIRERGCAAGFATDGDADRIGAMDADGNFVDPHKIFALILRHLVERRGLRGEVAKTFSASDMLDRMAAHYGLTLHTVPIGFKHIARLMLERDLLIGGEESGGIGIRPHLPERDGLLNSLLLAEIMATEEKSLAECVADLQQRFGPYHYCRLDLRLTERQKARALRHFKNPKLRKVGTWAIKSRDDLDGHKFRLKDDRWVLVRASGTEPLVRIYAEAEAATLAEKIANKTAEVVRTI